MKSATKPTSSNVGVSTKMKHKPQYLKKGGMAMKKGEKKKPQYT